MKNLIRNVLFVKSDLFQYSFSSANLENDLNQIFNAPYFNKRTNLIGKQIAENQFSLWEKWNFFRGHRSSDALAYFSGTIFNKSGNTYVTGTWYPHPLFVIGFYLLSAVFFLELYNLVGTGKILQNYAILALIGSFNVILISMSIYLRWRILKAVQNELKINKTP